MKNASFAAGMAIVLVANAIALIHAARNRAGIANAEITLTNRELRLFNNGAADDDSGVTLHLQWTVDGDYTLPYGNASPRWLDQQKLQRIAA